jgi:hypothetical protein
MSLVTGGVVLPGNTYGENSVGGKDVAIVITSLTHYPLGTVLPQHTPFGKYKYLRLPMGLKCSLDIAQAIMENVLSDIKDANIYIDDAGAFSSDWNHHVNLLATILDCLHKNGFTINPLKCEWVIRKTDWLGYIGLHQEV